MNFLSNFQPSARCRSELTTLGYGGYYREMLIGVGKQLSEEVVPGYSFLLSWLDTIPGNVLHGFSLRFVFF